MGEPAAHIVRILIVGDCGEPASNTAASLSGAGSIPLLLKKLLFLQCCAGVGKSALIDHHAKPREGERFRPLAPNVLGIRIVKTSCIVHGMLVPVEVRRKLL